jgi:ParB family chromosome partitioning protein
MSKPALGRGLGALLSGGAAKSSPAPAPTAGAAPPAAPAGPAVQRVPLAQIRPSPLQPRKDFTPEALQELADSIREQGIVQPLIVRSVNGTYELIAGERRWRAAQLAGLTEAPVVERAATDREVLELALIENLQRENLNAIEEAQGYSQLGEQFRLTQEEIAKKVGKSRAAVANALRLLKLPPIVQSAIREGKLSVGHAKVILGLADAALQQSAAARVLAGNLTVRQTEQLVAKLTGGNSEQRTANNEQRTIPRDAHVADLEHKLIERLSTKVALHYKAGKGSIEVKFFSDDELNRVLEILGVDLD